MFGILLGLAAGLAMPLQTSVNTKLGHTIRSPYLVSIISFAVGVVMTAFVLWCITGSVYIPLGGVAKEPWWIWLGGACGEILVISSMICLPKLGSTETMVMLVLGQIGSGIVIDSLGLFNSELIPLTLLRLLGFALVLGGSIAVASCDKVDDAGEAGNKWLYRIIAVTAGCFAGVQIAVNGWLGVVTGHAFRSTLISMSVGLITAVVLVGGLYLFKGGKSAVFDSTLPGGARKWWMFTGGLYGVFIVGSNAALATMVGTGLTVILNVTGQTFGGVVVDAVGFLGIEKKPVSLIKIVGIVAMIIGIVRVNMF